MPCQDGVRPTAPAPGRTVPNEVVVPVGPDDKVEIISNAGSTHVIADLFDYFTNA
ncbi:hypothetical protein [Kitasatospora herbaricolor]|uniref:Uncharacterized protein n=1 Tax=Kitasatospora herbaricolor TaxID=68217 RepID=A0ABZ1W8V7_9ACTN|nr:hypothetical protein [Kitasatospora herbaricolor]